MYPLQQQIYRSGIYRYTIYCSYSVSKAILYSVQCMINTCYMLIKEVVCLILTSCSVTLTEIIGPMAMGRDYRVEGTE